MEIFEFAKDYERLGEEELMSVDVESVVEKAANSISNMKGVRLANARHGLTTHTDSLLSDSSIT